MKFTSLSCFAPLGQTDHAKSTSPGPLASLSMNELKALIEELFQERFEEAIKQQAELLQSQETISKLENVCDALGQEVKELRVKV